MKKFHYPLLLLFSTWAGSAAAQTTTQTTAVPFLRIAADARGSGMASTGVATPADVSAVYYNAAKLPFAKKKAALSANYSPWLQEWSSDMSLASLAGFYQLSDNEAVHGLVRYFNPGDLQFTDNSGNHLLAYHPHEFSIEAGYSRKLSKRTGLGVSLEYIHSNLAKGVTGEDSYEAGNSIAADLGFYYDLRKQNEEGFSFGTQLSNLGSKISYTRSGDRTYFLPANWALGSSYTKAFDEENQLVLALDINKLLVPLAPSDSASYASYERESVVGSWFHSFSGRDPFKTFQASLGAEYWYQKLFAVRGGYFYEANTNGGRHYFSIGASVTYTLLTAHFAYLIPTGPTTIKNPLSYTLLFGLNLHFNH